MNMLLDNSAYLTMIFLFLNQNICCEYSKEPSRRDGSFEHTKQMFCLTDKKILTILGTSCFFIWIYVLMQRMFISLYLRVNYVFVLYWDFRNTKLNDEGDFHLIN